MDVLEGKRVYVLDGSPVEVRMHEPRPVPDVPETFVHDLWATQKFDRSRLVTTTGEPIEVLDPGRLNTDSGPDFRMARLRIGEVTWCGDVEIHLRSNMWLEHGHDKDPRYNGVVLHVSFQSDLWTGSLQRLDGSKIPETILAHCLDSPIRTLLYDFYSYPGRPIPCLEQWPYVPDDVRNAYLEDLAWERLESRSAEIAAEVADGLPLEQVIHERIFASLGYAKNSEPMRTLARLLPLQLCRQAPDRMDLQALHFGAAGLLPAPSDLLKADRITADHAIDLRDRFDRLTTRFEIGVMNRLNWQFFRLRPANFPTIRIAQGVALLEKWLLKPDPVGRVIAAIVSPEPIKALEYLLGVEPDPFWAAHVRLDKRSRPHSAVLGRDRIRVIVVNVLAPVAHHIARSQPDLAPAVRNLLRSLPPEEDEVTRLFTSAGQPCRSALAAQGLHQLYRTRCGQAHCLTCSIGQFLLGRG